MAKQWDRFDLHPGQVQVPCGRIQNNDHTSGQRCPPQVWEGSRLSERKHLVRQGTHHDRLSLAEKLTQCIHIRQVGTQKQRIVEETDQLTEFDTFSSSDRRADKHVLLPAVTVQQNIKGGKRHGEEGYPLLLTQFLENRLQPSLDGKIYKATVRRDPRGVWMIDGQLQCREITCQLRLPVLASRQATIRSQPIVKPGCIIDVLDGQGRLVSALPFGRCLVGLL